MNKNISIVISTIVLLIFIPLIRGTKLYAMKAGFSERDITPKIGMERPGGYGKSFHKDAPHDPCKVRAVVFDDGKTRVAFIGVDACFIPGSLVMATRKEIQKQCGILPEAVLMGASHTHSGGPTGMVQPGEFDHASDLVKRLAYELSSCADPVYLKMVQDAIVSAVVEADRRKVEARACVGSGYEDKVAFNRRLKMKNGLSYSHPGKGNPDIIEYAGPTDPEVGVIGVWDSNDKFLGCVVNYACHGTTGPGNTSADWIYYLERTIRNEMGKVAVVVFLNGACGDVTQFNNLGKYDIEFGERAARFVGTRVGAEAVKVLVSAEPGDLTPLSAEVVTLRIPRRNPSPERLKKSLEIVQKEKPGSTEWAFAKEIVMLNAIIQKEPVAEFEVQAIQVGPAVFVSNPAEFFCQLGLDIKKGSPFPFTYPVELANGCIGYVPTPEAFGPNGGGYETRLTAYSNLEVDAGAKIVETGIRLTRSMKPGVVPEPPKAKPFMKPWDYGNVPPETK